MPQRPIVMLLLLLLLLLSCPLVLASGTTGMGTFEGSMEKEALLDVSIEAMTALCSS
jgi:hypothetical protein